MCLCVWLGASMARRVCLFFCKYYCRSISWLTPPLKKWPTGVQPRHTPYLQPTWLCMCGHRSLFCCTGMLYFIVHVLCLILPCCAVLCCDGICFALPSFGFFPAFFCEYAVTASVSSQSRVRVSESCIVVRVFLACECTTAVYHIIYVLCFLFCWCLWRHSPWINS